jgi:hypothetical protein
VKESLKDMEKKKQGTYPPTSFTRYPEQDIEKLDDAKAQAHIKAQIETDKREQAEKAVREKALREGAPLPKEPATTSAAAPLKLVVAGKDFPETMWQICMAGGSVEISSNLLNF